MDIFIKESDEEDFLGFPTSPSASPKGDVMSSSALALVDPDDSLMVVPPLLVPLNQVADSMPPPGSAFVTVGEV